MAISLKWSWDQSMLSHFSHVWLYVTPEMAAHQAPPPLGFSRQQHWSGLPFLSPMHESESEVAQSHLTLSDPMDCSLPGSSIHGFSRQEYWSGVPLSSPGIRVELHVSSSLQYFSLATWGIWFSRLKVLKLSVLKATVWRWWQVSVGDFNVGSWNLEQGHATCSRDYKIFEK